MRFVAADYYTHPPQRRIVPGAIFLDVPILFSPSPRLPAVTLFPGGTFRHQDFARAWAAGPAPRRDEGIPVLVRVKARPVLVLRLGAGVTDSTYRRSIWVVPLYDETDPPRRGPNVFPLPPWPEAGLRFAGYADLYQATMVPQEHVADARYACELTEEASQLLLGALAIWAEGDPAPGA
jgi:hypothetical protein